MLLHPQVLRTYERDLEALAEGLGEVVAAEDQRAITAFWGFVERVVVEPSKAGDKVNVTVQGRLAALLDRDLFPTLRRSGGRW